MLIENYSFYSMEIKRDEFSLFDIDGPLDLIALKKSSRGYQLKVISLKFKTLSQSTRKGDREFYRHKKRGVLLGEGIGVFDTIFKVQNCL
jgi:hypothetical protein